MVEFMPQGFLQALAHNPDAMGRFALLPQARRAEVIAAARRARSKEDMDAIVSRL